MTQANIPLTKRTKQEILDEYEKLRGQIDDLRTASKTVHSQPAMELIETSKACTPQTIEKTFVDFQAALQTHLAEMKSSMIGQSTTLQEIQQAVEISRKQLELQRHTALAADALDQLMEDHAHRTTSFEVEMAQRERELGDNIALKKKAWEREAEEYEYQKKLRVERDRLQTEEQEKSLAAREAAIRTQEQEISQLKKAVEQHAEELERAAERREQEVTTRLTQQFGHEKALLEKEKSGQISLLQLTVKNLEDRLAMVVNETASFRQQADEANAKAQALAVKAIERPTTIVAPAPQPAASASGYHDRSQTRGNGQ